jgi:hypothetical protein
MLRNWRFWVLAALQLLPPAVFIYLGFAWLHERGWHLWGGLAWVAVGVVFGLLMARWTKSKNPVLPPIDWDSPRTFSPRDRQAWALVQAEAEKAEDAPMEALTTGDIYINTGRALAEVIARHYHPDAGHPVEHVPVVDILTALELAAEDLGRLCRELPGGDFVTPSHWKKAVTAAGYISKANEIYNYLLPFFQPAVGLVKLGTQKLMMQPAWKNMQQNLARWFFRAYVNRLGTHLIELYSGRLAIGADTYRRLKGRSAGRRLGEGEGTLGPLTIAVVGARGAGKSALVGALEAARSGDLAAVRRRIEDGGLDQSLVDLLREAEITETDAYTVHQGGEVARDRSTRRDAVRDAAEADLVLLVADGRRADYTPEARFVEAWLAWYAGRPEMEPPPALAVLTGLDRPELAEEATGGGSSVRVAVTRAAREAALRARQEALRKALPPAVTDVVPVGLGTVPPEGIAERLLPEIVVQLRRAEQTALIRHLHRHASRSKARRFLGQVGRQGTRLWQAVRPGRKGKAGK